MNYSDKICDLMIFVLMVVLALLISIPRPKEPQVIEIYANAEKVVGMPSEDVTEVFEEQSVGVIVTEEEYNLLARVCMSEAGGKYGDVFEGKVAVLETILNRVNMGYGTITEVITEPRQYSTADNGDPDETVFEAVDYVLNNARMFPENMIYFRTKHFHNFGIPYEKIGNYHYFSLKG